MICYNPKDGSPLIVVGMQGKLDSYDVYNNSNDVYNFYNDIDLSIQDTLVLVAKILSDHYPGWIRSDWEPSS